MQRVADIGNICKNTFFFNCNLVFNLASAGPSVPGHLLHVGPALGRVAKFATNKIPPVMDSIAWGHCASGNVLH